ncbi:hypothetical protein [Nocardia yamanashiensis]|uniref:hypothetical protein n=1 Tax=Nocardia yamanashiensis TaxID=209247 RepID=UPI000A6827F4|nr:hypothetical protein [Nocardia yamanashiensis]
MTLRRSVGRGLGTAVVGTLPALLVSAVVGGGIAHAEAKLPGVWCGLKVGDAKETVLAAMGAPNGHKADPWIAELGDAELTTAEWDEENSIFLATFDKGGRVVNLQAYDGEVGPNGATNIGCQPFRS